MLPLRARVDLGAMAIKGYSALPKAPESLEPRHEIVYCHIQDTRMGGGSYSAAEVQSVYSTAPADWAKSKKRDKYLDLVSELRKLWTMRVKVILIEKVCAWNRPKS